MNDINTWIFDTSAVSTMGREIITKKVRKGKAKGNGKKKEIKTKEMDNDHEVKQGEEEPEDEDIIAILMRKCKMTEDEVLDAQENFLERMPEGEMSKDDFLLESEVKQAGAELGQAQTASLN